MPSPVLSGPAGAELLVGLRPEAIRVGDEAAGGALPAKVFLIEPLGSEVIVNVTVGDRLINVRAAPDQRPAISSVVCLQAVPEGVRVFDAAPDGR